jgi:DNA repair exonuclease SbcCD ATPase subunit
MIKTLTGKAAFTSTGATLLVNFQPQTGITAVVGPNGSGKTFTASEAVRYLLFGSEALRGKMSDYAVLDLRGAVAIRGLDYDIVRTGREQSISHKGQMLAVGAAEVKKKIVELLGYGLDVFDVCNASMQGDTALFGKMKPAARKAMIDQILGVMDVQAVEKACRDEANSLKREAEAMTKLMRAPGDEPEEPVGYDSSVHAKQRLEDAREIAAEAQRLERLIAPLSAPTKPDCLRPDDLRIQECSAYERDRIDDEADLERAKRVARPDLSIEQINRGVEVYELEAEAKRRGPRPIVELDEVERLLKVWDQLDALEVIADQEVTCPKCDHKFRTRGELPEEPKLSRERLRLEAEAHVRWKTPLGTRNGDEPVVSPMMAETLRANHEAADAAGVRLRQPVMQDRSAELTKLLADRASWDLFEAQDKAYRDSMAANAQHMSALAALGEVPDAAALDRLSDALRDAEVYERERTRWYADLLEFKRLTEDINTKRKASEDFKAGAAGLADARATLKAYLAPTLSKVASSLIFDMTNGKLSSVVVDEDMDITVDRQRIETLSGAGATVANIALRIALGQILVGKAFPVFIGDEMDGDLDHERRQATIQAMVSLKDHLSQIILITHRGIDVADHVIDLGDIK